MPNWNPNFPEVLGLEWLITRGGTSRVWAGAPARIPRLPSTAAESIDTLRLGATVNPLLKQDTRTLIDVVEEGDEITPLFQPAVLAPNSDLEISGGGPEPFPGWTPHPGPSATLFNFIDEDPLRWPGPAQSTWIQNVNTASTAGGTGEQVYECSVDASAFDGGGALENARIGSVSIAAIYGANTGYRKLGTSIVINGVSHHPAGGALRDVHGFGSIHVLRWGELNPATGLPWMPADIADFDIGGTSKLRIRTHIASPTHYPKVFALGLVVHYVTVENRAAVGVWRRPNNLTARLVDVETDALISVPGGTPGWSKLSGRNYLYVWRQSSAPALFGAVNADDVRWNYVFQDLGPGGQPPGRAYPLHSSGIAPPPDDVLASEGERPYDQFGRFSVPFNAASPAMSGLVLIDDLGNPSVDSQPYRLDLIDLVPFRASTGIIGQRITMPSTQTYLGVRLPIIVPEGPPGSPGTTTLTVSVHLVSSGAQVGGSFVTTVAAVRALPKGQNGVRYVTGFLSSAATLNSGTAYEIRLVTTTGTVDWIAFAPNMSLGPEVGFGDGVRIGGGGVDAERTLVVNLIRQPDPPTGVTAAITNVAITTFVPGGVTTVEHVEISWTAPASGMGGLFARYELERQLDGGPWHRIANINSAAVLTLPDDDHEVPRDTEARYRARAVGIDGRFSDWAVSNSVTPTAPGAIAILTSNHRPDLEVVHAYDPESSHPILSTEGDEFVAIHGSDGVVVFMEDEDRGIGWRTRITINQVALQGKGGQHVFKPLTDIIRPEAGIPYVCALDNQGTGIFGHVTVTEVLQQQPLHIYTAQIDVVPTHTEPVPVEVT